MTRLNRNKFLSRLLSVILLLLYFLPGMLFSEIIYLKKGQAEVGRIVGQSPEYITIQQNGGMKRVPKREVLRINFQSSHEEEENALNQNSIEAMLEWQELLDHLLEKRREEHLKKEDEWEERTREEGDFFTDEILELKKRKREGAFYRSLFLPGWGQFYKNQSFKAYSLIGMTLLAAGVSYYSYNEYNRLSSDYDSSTMQYSLLFYSRHNFILAYNNYTTAKENRDNMVTNARNGKILLGTVAFIYALNVIDAYFTDVDLDVENEFASLDNSGAFDFYVGEDPMGKTGKSLAFVYSIRF